MKASEVLAQYAAGIRDFQGKNLRGESFKGQNLAGANFSQADLRSTDFTGANLQGVNFTGAKCGLQKLWQFFLLITLLIVSGLSGATSLLASKILSLLFHPVYVQKIGSLLPAIVSSSVLLLFLTALFILGFRKNLIFLIGIILICLIVGDVILWILMDSDGLILGQETSWKLSGIAGWTFAGIISGIASFSGAWAIFSPSVCLLVGAWIIGLRIAVKASDAVSVNLGLPSITPGLHNYSYIEILIALILLIIYACLSVQVLLQNSKYLFFQEIIQVFYSFKGTSFYKADLTDANFTGAKLESTDMREANLIRVRWYGAKMLDRLRPGNTYLNNLQIREWLIGIGRDKNFDDQKLQGINLQGADLTDASFINANLNEANLQDANLSRTKLIQTQLDKTDFTGATLTGACIEDWGITTHTKLDDVKCEYIFMRCTTKDDPNPRRKPDNWEEVFTGNDFADFIKPIQDTLDLYHNQGVDPRAIAIAWKQLIENNPDAQLQFKSLEVKGEGNLLLRFITAMGADLSRLNGEYFDFYNRLKGLTESEVAELIGQYKQTRYLVDFLQQTLPFQPRKTIKIFLASSSELASDLQEFEIFINRKNKEYIKQNIFLELVLWSDFIDAMSATRLQDEYNKAVQGCDIFVSLFHTKVGKYTEEEFLKALETFQANGKPLIYTYFNQAKVEITPQIVSILNFQQKLSDMGHFYTKYDNIDDLKFQFSEQLAKTMNS